MFYYHLKVWRQDRQIKKQKDNRKSDPYVPLCFPADTKMNWWNTECPVRIFHKINKTLQKFLWNPSNYLKRRNGQSVKETRLFQNTNLTS